MHPAFSVIFLTTLLGVGQGLFLALYTGQIYSLFELLPLQDSRAVHATGAAISLLFLTGGLVASFFHLGHPERPGITGMGLPGSGTRAGIGVPVAISPSG